MSIEEGFAELCHQRLEKNLECIRSHRPELHARIVDCDVGSRYRIAATAGSLPTIVYHAPGQPPAVLSIEGDPRRTVEKLSVYCDEEVRLCRPIALGDLGDGYFLSALANTPVKGQLGESQAVWIFVPDTAAILPCLMLHDYTGPDGPIEQPRYYWFVGPTWEFELESALRSEPFLPLAHKAVRLGPAAMDVSEGVSRVYQRLEDEFAGIRSSVDELARAWRPDRLALQFGAKPDRAPRLLIMTSRFTSVLQYVARDTARAFRRAGWSVAIVKEPSDHHRLTVRGGVLALVEHRPDAAMMLSRLRYENAKHFPPDLPYIAWLQDAMPSALCAEAGASIGDRDFVLSYAPGILRQYGYPENRVVPVPIMVTSPRDRPPHWSSDGADLVYVSHASQTPQQRVATVVGRLDSRLQGAARNACRCVEGVYENGDQIDSVAALRSYCAAELERLDPEDQNLIVDTVLGPINTQLYRQEALHWIADIADETGRRLAIHGIGWEAHPRFACYAAGAVANGPELDELTRRSRINLVLEPYPCHTHQRLLDGLAAGGFFLIREHPVHRLWSTLALQLLDGVESVEDWLERSPDPEALRLLIERAGQQCYETPPDPLRQLRAYLDSGVLLPGEPDPIPGLDRVLFSSKEHAAERIDAFLADESARREIAEQQWESVRGRLTFGRVVERIHQELANRFEVLARQEENA